MASSTHKDISRIQSAGKKFTNKHEMTIVSLKDQNILLKSQVVNSFKLKQLTNELNFLYRANSTTDSFKQAETRSCTTLSFHTMDAAAKSHVRCVHRLTIF